uniref:Uncharacterized protein n=1 Tax=Anguilla anguilla TaxID=7936 RepID=A0A0E9SCE9_ANGAN
MPMFILCYIANNYCKNWSITFAQTKTKGNR